MAIKIDGAAALKLRMKLGENQTDFWSRLGVTQSGGCRYEAGRAMSPTLKRLYYLVYMNGTIGSKEYNSLKRG
ncbi:MAG TPA: hypothetical protein DCS05_05445 [Nitrospiraceae bacterium]|nr:hypothetical protein [Nitrospiraceae bacterium]